MSETRIVSSFPREVREIEHVDVPMPDGCRLAARIWLPEDAERNPVPAILEYIPYRKNDLTAVRDVTMHPYTAGHGYAVVRLDLRGAGDSEGLMPDEYLQQELEDGFHAIARIAAQPWCDGNVGMVGISWGGFNGLQVAALQPPALKAVISVCSTDDRYADDVHYQGGALLIDNLAWASTMFGRNSLPPDPRHNPDGWRELWHQRLKGSGLWIRNWLEHQTRDDFWKHGSVCEDFARIRCPVYAVSGWADGYFRSVFRLMQGLEVPRKGLVGPRAHKYPHLGVPGPAIGFLRESLRWWDHWLKGRDTGIMDEPMLRLWMQDTAPPRSMYAERPGRWVAEPAWPSPNVARTGYALGSDGRIVPAPARLPDAPVTLSSPESVGMAGGRWCPYGKPGDLALDQRLDDGGSLCFETEPLAEPLEIAGDPVLELCFTPDRPVALVAARLSDVAPDGGATRVTWGVLNLTHRDSHQTPAPLAPGRMHRARIELKHIAQRFAAGHRIRLALSTAYFPMVWPAPERVSLTVHPGESSLELPIRSASTDDDRLAPFAPPEQAPPLEREQLVPGESVARTLVDQADGSVTTELVEDSGTYRLAAIDLTIRSRGTERYRVHPEDPTSASGEVVWEWEMSRGDWRVATRTETRLICDAESFHIRARLEAREGDWPAHVQEWDEAIPRNHV
ncbi:MAG TPA: CocE/NonD family hydrolase [Thermohalobaculum sp.]|nr:CocE/NonD family hydrolase [Thermohalobaculum sp.]